MREGKFLEINKKTTNFFLEKGKGVGKKRFTQESGAYENMLSNDEGKVNDRINENKIELTVEQETVVQEVMAAAQEVVDQFIERPVVLQREQIAIVRSGALKEMFSEVGTEKDAEKIAGHTFEHLQKVAVEADKDTPNIELALILFHELMHLGSFYRIRLTQKKEHEALGHYRPERSGLSVLDSNGDAKFFRYLDEALTEKLARLYIETQKNNPLYKKNFSLREDKFSDAAPGTYVGYEEHDGRSVPVLRGAYHKELLATEDLMMRLYRKNNNRFASEEELWNVFLEAKFTGKLLNLARLIEKTEGKDTFRLIGEQSNISQEERDK